MLATKRRKKHKHFLDHEEHEERLKNKFIVRRKMAAKRHRRISGKQGIRMWISVHSTPIGGYQSIRLLDIRGTGISIGEGQFENAKIKV